MEIQVIQAEFVVLSYVTCVISTEIVFMTLLQKMSLVNVQVHTYTQSFNSFNRVYLFRRLYRQFL